MNKSDPNRVVYYSRDDMMGPTQLKKGEELLRGVIKNNYTDINDILELYNIKKYIDNELYLHDWTAEDIINFKQKTEVYGKIIGQFISNVNDSNILQHYENIPREYINSFWELVNNQSVFKRISNSSFSALLLKEPHLIYILLTFKNIVEHYNIELRTFLMTFPQSAEILISIYEVKNDFNKKEKFLPKSLTIEDKENIISSYLDSSDVNYNYIGLIQNVRNRNDFKISDKTRLKAKRLHKTETEKFFAENKGSKYGVTVGFRKNVSKIKDVSIDDEFVAHFTYSLDYINQNNNPYSLFQNFKYLFEYVDIQNRINLVSKKSQLQVFERVMGLHSQNEYRGGTAFNFTEMSSHLQIVYYNEIVAALNTSLEGILHYIFTSAFKDKYEFADNARLSIPPASNSYFEKVRLLAPEFESVLKQFKLFVENGNIDFELLQISSSPSAIKEIPSLNQKKYIYFNEKNEVAVSCSNLFFSDQTLLAYVEPFKEKQYRTFLDLLLNEEVKFGNYEEHQKPQLNYLIEKGFITVDVNDFIQVLNPTRIRILHDLYVNEVASLHRYSLDFRQEALQMEAESYIFTESSLFSKPEQAYLNYFLNKSEFTNGLDLRNSYLHGTQATPDEIQKHEYSYFTYLKLLFLTLLKIEDDLIISKTIKERN